MRICSLRGHRLKQEWNQMLWPVNNLRCGIAVLRMSCSGVETQLEKKRALSVPENTGRRGLYTTVLVGGTCRGRPFMGRAAVRSHHNQIESLPAQLWD